MSNKKTGIIIGTVAGAIAGAALAAMSCQKGHCSRKSSSFARATSNILDTAGNVFLNMSDMLR